MSKLFVLNMKNNKVINLFVIDIQFFLSAFQNKQFSSKFQQENKQVRHYHIKIKNSFIHKVQKYRVTDVYYINI